MYANCQRNFLERDGGVGMVTQSASVSELADGIDTNLMYIFSIYMIEMRILFTIKEVFIYFLYYALFFSMRCDRRGANKVLILNDRLVVPVGYIATLHLTQRKV